MAKLLDQYLQKQNEMRAQITGGRLPAESLLAMQELNYRIYVLETLQSFVKSAPVTMELQPIGYHYQALSAFVRLLVKEHKLGLKADENMQKKRETARGNLETISQDSNRQFQSFQMTTTDQYKRSVSGMINAILSAWIQYRNTYLEV